MKERWKLVFEKRRKLFMKTDLLFIILFAIAATYYYDSVLTKGPLNTHLWKQTDCLSLTRNFSRGASFFSPEMNSQLGDKFRSGHTASEFPVLYYIVGMIWKFFGESYVSYRLFYLMILFAGLFAFYKSIKLLFEDAFWAAALSVLLFTSPVYVVYGVSFIPDVPAFSFILVALYYFLRYSLEKKSRLFLLSMAFFALAGLIKVSSLIAFVSLLCVFLLEVFSVKTLINRKLFRCNRLEWAGFISVIIIVFSWYSYVDYYNALHGFKSTLNSASPIWQLEKGAFLPLVKGIKNFTSYVFFSRPVLMILLLIGIANLFLIKKMPLFAYISNILIILGGATYFILWTPLLDVHDYYFIALLILFAGILMPFTWFVKTRYPVIFKGNFLKILLGVFLLYNFLYCQSVVRLKTVAQKGDYIVVGNHEFVAGMQWTNWDVDRNWKRFGSMKPYILQLGIKAEDKVISLPDKSPNVSLFLMDRKGWTDNLNYSKSEDIRKLIQCGAKYLLVSDPEFLKQGFLQAFLTQKIGSYKGIEIFKLSEHQGI